MTITAPCPCCGAEVQVNTWIERQGVSPNSVLMTDGEISEQPCGCRLTDEQETSLVIDVIARVEAGDGEPDWESE